MHDCLKFIKNIPLPKHLRYLVVEGGINITHIGSKLEVVKLNYCPNCGKPTAKIFEDIQAKAINEKAKKEERTRAKLEQAKRKIELERTRDEREQQKILEDWSKRMAEGTYNIYETPKGEYKGVNKKHARHLASLKNISIGLNDIKCIRIFRKGVEETFENPTPKISSNSIENKPPHKLYDLDKTLNVYKTIVDKKEERYKINKALKVGESMNCCNCNKPMTKKQYSQVFCSIKCKDKYWNAKQK